MGSDSSSCVSLDELVGLCLFAGCEFSAIVSFDVRKRTFRNFLSLLLVYERGSTLPAGCQRGSKWSSLGYTKLGIAVLIVGIYEETGCDSLKVEFLKTQA
jgi:hypothetical protein